MDDNAKYNKIYENIRQKISNNFYHQDQLMPSEKQLCDEYGVSRRTIRRAIEKLVEERYLYTVPGKGTMVHMRTNNKYEVSLKLEDILINGYDIAKLCVSKIQNPDIFQVYNLQVAPTEKVLFNTWTILRDSETIAYDVKAIPYFPGIPIGESDLSYKTLREMLSTKFLQYEIKEKVNITSVFPEMWLSKALNTQPLNQKTVLKIDTKIYDSDMMPLGWNELYVKANECVFSGRLVD